MHNLTMAIYIQYIFHEILSVGYLVVAEEGKADGRTDGQHQTNIPLPSVGGTGFQAGPTFPIFPYFFDLLLLFPTFS